MSVDWKTKIGKKVEYYSGRRGELVRFSEDTDIYGTVGTWKVQGDDRSVVLHTEPTLIPEWEPKEGEWVMNVGHPFVMAFKYDGRAVDRCRPPTDKEKIEICGGIEAMAQVLRRTGYAY